MGKIIRWSVLILFLLAVSGCTDLEKDKADIFITVSLTDEGYEPYVNVRTDIPMMSALDFQSKPKNPAATLTSTNDVTLYRMVVEWIRTDGGTVTPKPFNFGLNHLLPAGSTLTIENIPLMSFDQMDDPPFSDLFPWNGGVDSETGKTTITCDAHFIFYGRTASGVDVNAELKGITYYFSYF